MPLRNCSESAVRCERGAHLNAQSTLFRKDICRRQACDRHTRHTRPPTRRRRPRLPAFAGQPDRRQPPFPLAAATARAGGQAHASRASCRASAGRAGPAPQAPRTGSVALDLQGRRVASFRNPHFQFRGSKSPGVSAWASCRASSSRDIAPPRPRGWSAGCARPQAHRPARPS
jgi:hypothetical protein